MRRWIEQKSSITVILILIFALSSCGVASQNTGDNIQATLPLLESTAAPQSGSINATPAPITTSSESRGISNTDPITPRALGSSVIVQGSVTTLSGTPIAEASVSPSPLTARVANNMIGIVTNNQGKYTLSLDPGRYDITVFATGYLSQTVRVDFSDGQPQTLDFVLKPREH